MTPRELIRQAAASFEQAGIPDPIIDASLLLAHLTGQQALFLRADSWSEVAQETAEAFEALCQRRLTREPLQYLLGEQSFLGRSFYVDERVLIPRPETELLAERAIEALKKTDDSPAALDMCCGSGCLAVSMALEVPAAQVQACDLSEGALAVTRRNAETLGAKVSLHQGDLFDALPHQRFDVIVSNPPYIPSDDCRALQPEVMQEPAMALDGGADGYSFYRRIAEAAPHWLKPDGTLLLEVGFDQARTVAAMLEAAGLRCIAIYEDYQHIERMVQAHL